jgi:hypothetical protein
VKQQGNWKWIFILGCGMSGLYRAGALKEAIGHLVCEEEGVGKHRGRVEDVWGMSLIFSRQRRGRCQQ